MKDDFEHSRGRGSPTEIWIAAAPQRLFFKDEMLQSACPPFGTKQTFVLRIFATQKDTDCKAPTPRRWPGPHKWSIP